MAMTYGQEQADRNLARWQGMSGQMRRPSELASPEEREAYMAQQVRGGEAPAYELPEAYGGMPMGSTRRAFRARAAWEQEQAQIAAYNQEMAARQKAAMEARKEQLAFERSVLDYQAAEYDQLSQQETEAREARIRSEDALDVLRFQSIASQFNPRDPESFKILSGVLAERPSLAANEDIQKSMWSFQKASEDSVVSMNAKLREDLDRAKGEARRAGVPEEDIDRVVLGAKERDEQGNEFINIEGALVGVTQLTDTTLGKRAVSTEERKGQPDTRTPLEKAQDELAEANAKLSAFGETEAEAEKSDAYVRALGEVKAAEVKIQRLGGGSGRPAKQTTTAEYTPEQIAEAKRIANDPNHSRNQNAIRFLNSIGESY